MKQEDVTNGDTGDATEAANEVKAETEEGEASDSSDVVGVEELLLLSLIHI